MSLWSLPLPARSRNSRKEIKQPARKLFSCNAVHLTSSPVLPLRSSPALQLIHYPRAHLHQPIAMPEQLPQLTIFRLMPHARRVIFVQQLQQDLGILAVGLLPADSLGANPHQQSIGHMRQGTPWVDSHCPPDPGHRIVPNAPKRSVERQEELLAVSASTCSRLQSIR